MDCIICSDSIATHRGVLCSRCGIKCCNMCYNLMGELKKCPQCRALNSEVEIGGDRIRIDRNELFRLEKTNLCLFNRLRELKTENDLFIKKIDWLIGYIPL